MEMEVIVGGSREVGIAEEEVAIGGRFRTRSKGGE